MAFCDGDSNVPAMLVMLAFFVALTWLAISGECNQTPELR